jgi:hypothetical protein
MEQDTAYSCTHYTFPWRLSVSLSLSLQVEAADHFPAAHVMAVSLFEDTASAARFLLSNQDWGEKR